MNSNLVAMGSGKRPKQPKRYERPSNAKDTKRVGNKNAMTHNKMVAWIEQKRAEHAKRQKTGGDE